MNSKDAVPHLHRGRSLLKDCLLGFRTPGSAREGPTEGSLLSPSGWLFGLAQRAGRWRHAPPYFSSLYNSLFDDPFALSTGRRLRVRPHRYCADVRLLVPLWHENRDFV